MMMFLWHGYRWCTLHSQNQYLCGVHFHQERGYLSKCLGADIFGFKEVESYNLRQMCSISRAMNECIGALVHLCVCLWAWDLESGAHLKFQFIWVLLKLGDYNFYGKSPVWSTVDLYDIRSKYIFDIKISKIQVFLYSVPFRPLALYCIVYICLLGTVLFQINVRLLNLSLFFTIIHFWIKYVVMPLKLEFLA